MAAGDGRQLEFSALNRIDLARLLLADSQRRVVRKQSLYLDENPGHPLVIDFFAGHGGATTGIEAAIGRPVDIAINHSLSALSVHIANNPQTKHYIEDIYDVDPLEATGGRPVGLIWASPDCTFHSRARGAKPIRQKDRRSRGLAAVIIRWAREVRPYCIAGENVLEFMDWGPTMRKLDRHGRHAVDKHGHRLYVPDPSRRGAHFRRWKRALERLGYRIQLWEIKASEHGAPTIRTRIYWVAKLDGEIVRPQPTHGPGRAHAYRSAAECIDWSIVSRSIFDRPKPLKENSLVRIANGVVKHVIANPAPYLVASRAGVDSSLVVATHVAKWRGESPGSAADAPLPTVTSGKSAMRPAGAAHALGLIETHLAPVDARCATLVKYYGEGGQHQSIEDSAHTITGKARLGLVTVDAVAAFMAQHNGGYCDTDGRPVTEPLSAVTSSGSQQQLVTAHVTNFYTSNVAGGEGGLDQPLRTITAGGQHQGLVEVHLSEDDEMKARRCAEFLRKYYRPSSKTDPELVARAHDGVVSINGRDFRITDIHQRMLEPKELARCQSFPEHYEIAPECWYRTNSGALKFGRLPKHEQIAGIGNSVCPVVAEAIIRANYSDDMVTRQPAAWRAAA